ncbi:MAG TPA: hypothetical protein ENJ09_07630 [Planctomycetes bacterium]|nr:hypothetical protein [Planctomycetota bacterium]
MDGLALLTNLHADGPLSLRRLRAAGVRSLAELTELPQGLIAQLLHLDDRGAARLKREASALSERIGEEPFEEDPARGPAPGHGVRPAADARAGDEPPPRPAGSQPTEDPPVPLPRYPPPAPVHVEGTLLRVGFPKGMRARALEGLVGEGVRTVRALIDLASLPLARRAGIPYTVLLALRFQARRELEFRLGVSKASTARGPRPEPELREVTLRPRPRTHSPVARVASLPGHRSERVYAAPRPDGPDGPDGPFPVAEPRGAAQIAPSRSDPGVAGPFV